MKQEENEATLYNQVKQFAEEWTQEERDLCSSNSSTRNSWKTFTWDEPLTRQQRSLIHDWAEKFGIHHFSSGNRKNRRISIRAPFHGLPQARFDSSLNRWTHISVSSLEEEYANAALHKDKFVVASFNVLFDINMGGDYDLSALLYTEQRRPHIFSLLEKTEADVIALQEVTPEFHKLLLEQPWVKDRYFVSDVTGWTVTPTGNLLLSTFPFRRLCIRVYSPPDRKSMLLGEVRIRPKERNKEAKTLSIAAVHWKAGKQDTFAPIRAMEIHETICFQRAGLLASCYPNVNTIDVPENTVKATEGKASEAEENTAGGEEHEGGGGGGGGGGGEGGGGGGGGGEEEEEEEEEKQQQQHTIEGQEKDKWPKDKVVLLIGDCNFKRDECHEELEEHYDDAWVRLHPDDAGYTYDLDKNPIASLVSNTVTQVKGTTGTSCRFDRILLGKQNKEENAATRTFEPLSIEMFGTEPVFFVPDEEDPQKQRAIFASDHFGLRAVFSSPA